MPEPGAFRLHGVVTPIITPLTPTGALDHSGLTRLVDQQLDAGVHGLFVLGTCGEGAQFTRDQRREIIAVTVEHTAGRVPVLAGVIDTSTARVAEAIADADTLGADGFVATAPFYQGVDAAEIDQHFRLLAEVSDRPLLAYNIPVRLGGTALSPALVLRLAADGVIAGIKDSSGVDAVLRQLLRGRRDLGLDDFVVFTGSELTVDSALAAGCDGVVPGLGNIDPAGYVRIVEAITADDTTAARAEQDRLLALFDLVAIPDPTCHGPSSAALGAFKSALVALGVIDHPTVVAPGSPLTAVEHDLISDLLLDHGLAVRIGAGE